MGKTFLILIVILALSTTLFPQEIIQDSLDNFIQNVIEYMPGKNSRGFRVPEPWEMERFGELVEAILGSLYEEAALKADSLGYQLYRWRDTGNANHPYWVLAEKQAAQWPGVEKGWGSFIFNPGGKRNLGIEIPHPLFDTNTWQIGLSAFKELDCRYFLMAGTHRYANGDGENAPAVADVAHSDSNMFYIVHQKIAPLASHTLQIHGFNRSSDRYRNYPDVVLSNGTDQPSAILDTLSENLTTYGFSCGIFDGEHYGYLGATTNTEGRWSNSQGLSFIHAELEYYIRMSPEYRADVVRALSLTFPVIQTAPESEEFLVSRNFPNPFIQETSIRLNLPAAGVVHFQVYDLRGRIVFSEDYNLDDGENYILWDGKDYARRPVASGFYLYRISWGDKSVTGKMILLRQ